MRHRDGLVSPVSVQPRHERVKQYLASQPCLTRLLLIEGSHVRCIASMETSMTEKQPAKGEGRPCVTPVAPGERIVIVDILRGFALFGVLAANMAGFAGHAPGLEPWREPLDRLIYLLIRFLIEAKFYSLFSFLFGWGMAVQMIRAEGRGTRFVPLFLRRMFILLAFGLLHGIFLWTGDILTIYALYGMLLLTFRRRSSKFILLAVGVTLLVPIILQIPGEAMDGFRTWYADLTAPLRSTLYSTDLYRTGTYIQITKLRLEEFIRNRSWLIYTFGNVFGMFLLGLTVGKRKIFHNLQEYLPLVRKVMRIGLAIGVTFNGIYVSSLIWRNRIPDAYYQLVRVGSRTIGAPALMLFYVTAIILLAQREKWFHRLEPLAYLGRMALSNYITQSIIGTLIFYKYGLGLFGRTDPTFGLLLTVSIYFVQIRISQWWLARYRFGPLEWIWRSLTYLKLQPHKPSEDAIERSLLRPIHRWYQQAAWADSYTALALAWLVLIAWAAGLILWNNSLSSKAHPAIQVSSGRTIETPSLTAELDAPQEAIPTPEHITESIPALSTLPDDANASTLSGDILALASRFNPEEAAAQIADLTAPPFLGRQAGSPEGWAAGEYIAGKFDSFGLLPAGDDDTFFQSFDVSHISLTNAPSLTITLPDGTLVDDYTAYEDFAEVIHWYEGEGSVSGQVVWANNCEHGDFDSLDAVDKLVFCREQTGTAAARNALEHGAKGLLLLGGSNSWPIDFRRPNREAWVPEPIPSLRITPTVAEDLLTGTDLTLDDLSISFTSYPLLTEATVAIEVAGPEACAAEGCVGRNVLGLLPGRDPDYRDELIILGAHYDHMGQIPNGVVWAGANDNASGVAVLLEIARTWHEQGYTPRRSVLFAAWDAEEIGLIGSTYYVEHPRYALDDTLASLQMDMVGVGADTLYIDGLNDQARYLQSIASSLDIDTALSDHRRSDHGPFMRVGIQANLLSWFGEDVEIPTYHRPSDTLSTIQFEKLDAVGEIASLATLGIVEGEPGIHDILDRRAAAVLQNDLLTFLTTSTPDASKTDRLWFTSVQQLTPREVEINPETIHVFGDTASASVDIKINYPSPDAINETRTSQTSMLARFKHGPDGWKWAGPDLVSSPSVDVAELETSYPGCNFTVSFPVGAEIPGGLALKAAEQYNEIADRLGLSGTIDADIMLLPNSSALSAIAGPTISAGKVFSVSPGLILLVYEQDIDTTTAWREAFIQLLLADAGIEESALPWLWQGLAGALENEENPQAIQARFLPLLSSSMLNDVDIPQEAASWAAAGYLQDRLGWEGVGRFITAFGNACKSGLCQSEDGIDSIMIDLLGMDTTAFTTAWQRYWRNRLASVQAQIDAVMQRREEAISLRSESAFLATVDATIPGLAAEQKHWFEDLINQNVEQWSIRAQPIGLQKEGGVLAEVSTEYVLSDDEGLTNPYTIRQTISLTNHDGELQWAGQPYQSIESDRALVMFPNGQEAFAQTLLGEVERTLPTLEEKLPFQNPAKLTIKLYENTRSLKQSALITAPGQEDFYAWTGAGEAIKIVIQSDLTESTFPSLLVTPLTQAILYQNGVDSEWMLKGLSTYIAGSMDGRTSEKSVAMSLKALRKIVLDGLPYSLSTLPPDHLCQADELEILKAFTWDTIRYLAFTYGSDALQTLLLALADGQDIDHAVHAVTGISLQTFTQAWQESLSRGHTSQDWIDIAMAFDEDQALKHITFLASPQNRGRQPGSPGERSSAAYIAAWFDQYGLTALIPDSSDQESERPSPPSNEDLSVSQDDFPSTYTFVQPFPIQFTTLLSTPQIDLYDSAENHLGSLDFREGFTLLPQAMSLVTSASGKLVWVRGEYAEGMNFNGGIVLRNPTGDLSDEIAQAYLHGAGGLLLIGTETSTLKLLNKEPLPTDFSNHIPIPVLELTPDGFDQLLAHLGYAQNNLHKAPDVLPLGLNIRIEIPLSDLQQGSSANVLGLLPGSDPELSDEVIILGAHYDHVGDDPGVSYCGSSTFLLERLKDGVCEIGDGLRYPGANDDASGVAVMLEILRLWDKWGYRPRRSVLFAAWGAQEAGERGSRYYVQNPVIPLEQTLAMMQLESVGGGNGYYLEAHYEWDQDAQVLFYLSSIERLVEGRLAPTTTQLRNDHQPFDEVGIPSILLTWRGSQTYNLPEGMDDEIDAQKLGKTGRMVALSLMTLAR
jgi:uncharacterized protein